MRTLGRKQRKDRFSLCHKILVPRCVPAQQSYRAVFSIDAVHTTVLAEGSESPGSVIAQVSMSFSRFPQDLLTGRTVCIDYVGIAFDEAIWHNESSRRLRASWCAGEQTCQQHCIGCCGRFWFNVLYDMYETISWYL